MPDSPPEIRFAENCPMPVEDLHELWNLAGWSKAGQRTVDKTAEALERSDFYVCAFARDKMIGFARVCGDPYIAQVLDVLVHPDFRRLGIATEMMRRIGAHLDEAQYISVTLTDGSGYDAFYERHGFRRVDACTPQRVYRPATPLGETV